MKVFKLSSLTSEEFKVDSCKFFKILFEFYSFLHETSKDHEFGDSAYTWLRYLNTRVLSGFGAHVALPDYVKDSISGFVNSNLSVRQRVITDLSNRLRKQSLCLFYETKAKNLIALGIVLTNDLYDYKIEELVEWHKCVVASCSLSISGWEKGGFGSTYFSN